MGMITELVSLSSVLPGLCAFSKYSVSSCNALVFVVASLFWPIRGNKCERVESLPAYTGVNDRD